MSNQGSQLVSEETDDVKLSEAKTKYLLECHMPPIVWTRSQSGFRVQGMTDRHYYDVTTLIKKDMAYDPFWKPLHDDEEAKDAYASLLMDWYPKTQSLVALKEGTKEVMGVLIGRLVIEPKWFEVLKGIEFVQKKDRYADLKRRPTVEDADAGKAKLKESRGGKKSKKSSRKSTTGRKSTSGARKSKSGSRKSTSGARKSKSGARKSTSGARKSTSGARKSTGGARKSTGGARKSTSGARKSTSGARKSTSGARKSTSGARKSTSGARKSTTGRKSAAGGNGGRASMGEKKHPRTAGKSSKERKDDWRVPRPDDIYPEEETPLEQPEIFDDDAVVYDNPILQELHRFKKDIAEKVNVWSELGLRMYYRLYTVAVSVEYQREGVYDMLFESLLDVCKAFNVKGIAGILTTYAPQNAFYHIGGQIYHEVLYEKPCKPTENGLRSYDCSAAFMCLKVEDAVR